MPNRLANEASPYLLQHKDNPVDWWPWGEEAWALARAEQKPVFLSVGYSSCHWCHVMAHESFEDDEAAQALNGSFVSIKLDREERPDVDEAYMTAVQLAHGHGGWPMSVFLTPDKKPFFAGTYFPRESRGGHPSFLQVVNSLATAWRESRADVERTADEFATALAGVMERNLPASSGVLDVQLLDRAVEAFHQDFDHEHGGFGDRPKFPPHAALLFLCDYARYRPDLPGDSGELPGQAALMALLTLERLALGGIYDHVGGGFHRYSTDDRWLLPHFEKMLYDNAQLLTAYSEGRKLAGDPRLQALFDRTVERTSDWIEREMTAESGLYMSALDADSEGEEGLYYLWTTGEVDEALTDRAPGFAATFGLTAGGNYLDEATGRTTGRNVLNLERDVEGLFESELDALRNARSGRVRPGTDHKCLASWNGLTIGAMAQAGRVTEAVRASRSWLGFLEDSGLPHMVTDGRPSGQPFLDDLAFLADGFLDLADVTEDDTWRSAAMRLARQMVERHGGPSGGCTFTAHDGEALFGRSKPFMDNATPSPNGVAARVFRRLGLSTESRAVLDAGLGWMERAPAATPTLLREALLALVSAGGVAGRSEPARPTQDAQIGVTLVPRELEPDDDGFAYAEIVLDIPEGVHVNSDDPAAKWLVPTDVEVDGAYAEAAYPENKDGTYRGRTVIGLRIRAAGAQGRFEVRVRFQSCTESECSLPEVRVVEGRLK
ncbi:MAG: DUF255 domain-containing protein [Armatimonadetes bacterium]|nr:DUF255 domain-containing protein [Armatimonadota bacterium]